MNTLKNFIDNQAEGLLQQSDLVSLTGGGPNGDGLVKDINALADCGTTNNCNSGNCTAQCGCNKSETVQKYCFIGHLWNKVARGVLLKKQANED